MIVISKTFVNPLLAIAFKDGVDFVGDPNYRAMDPKQEGATKWTVLVECDDEDEDDAVVVHSSLPQNECEWCGDDFHGTGQWCSKKCQDEDNSHNLVETKPVVEEKRPMTTMKDYEDRLRSLKPVVARSAPGQENFRGQEIIHPPVKIREPEEEPEPDTEPEPLPPLVADWLPPALAPENIHCGECLPCISGADCIRAIEAACLAMPGRER